jgi:hypothetical protein
LKAEALVNAVYKRKKVTFKINSPATKKFRMQTRLPHHTRRRTNVSSSCLINLHGSSLQSPNYFPLSTVYGTRAATRPTTHLRRVFPHQPHPFNLLNPKVVTPETSQVDTSPLKAGAW